MHEKLKNNKTSKRKNQKKNLFSRLRNRYLQQIGNNLMKKNSVDILLKNVEKQ